MPVIHLVRHGQASADAVDYDVLSPLGDRQARIVGRELARRGLRQPRVLSGTLRRQLDTAKAFVEAATLAAPPSAEAAASTTSASTDPRWNEYDHLDLVTRYPAPGTQGGLQEHLDHALAAWIDDPAGGWDGFQRGAFEALRELTAERGRDTVVITSGGVIAAVCGVLLDLPSSGVVALNRVTVNTGVTTILSGSTGRISLLTFNDHAHLAAHRPLLTYR